MQARKQIRGKHELGKIKIWTCIVLQTPDDRNGAKQQTSPAASYMAEKNQIACCIKQMVLLHQDAIEAKQIHP